jgi:hypothetical protein
MARTSTERRALAGFLALVLMLAIALVACGDDDDDAAESGATTTAAGAKGDLSAYCATSLALETIPEPDIDFESLSPEQLKEETRKFTEANVVPLVRQIEPLIPDEIKADAKVLIDGVEKVRQSGDFQAFESDPQTQAAEAKVHKFDLANCGWQRVDVTATEYKFDGVPSKLDAGPTSFDLTNQGKEPHELAILRINDDVDESFADIVKLPEEQARQMTKGVGGAFAEPSKSAYGVVKLTAGRYAIACFVPVGGGDEGPPHVTKGMFVEFEVS